MEDNQELSGTDSSGVEQTTTKVQSDNESTNSGSELYSGTSTEDNDPIGLDQFKKGQEEIKPEGEEKSEVETVEGEEEGSADDIITIDGKEYAVDDLKQALEAKYNESKWQKMLTQRAQAVADKEKQLDERLAKIDKLTNNKNEPEESEEVKQTKEWLEKNGYVSKNYIDEKLGDLVKWKQEQDKEAAIKQVADELDTVKEKYNLSDSERAAVWDYAVANDMADQDMEIVYLAKNRDKIGSFITGKGTDEERIAAANKRKERLNGSQTARKTTTTPDATLNQYVSERDKDKPLDELIARYFNNQGS